MEKMFKNRCFFNAIMLICLAGFLILPKISLADDLDNITPREAAKYLELSESKVRSLIHSFINVFHSEWAKLMTDPASSSQKTAVPIIMKRIIQTQVQNDLLIDAPAKTILTIIQSATKAARLFLSQDYSVVLNELEKESVDRAVNYGMDVLLENEIRVGPGAIGFEYELKQGGTGWALIQYVMIYKPLDAEKGEMAVRFYSPNPLKPPQNKMNFGMARGMYTDLEDDLPPFIVEAKGIVREGKLDYYQWIEGPLIEIDFSPEVPDFGIRPLNFWERFLLKPIETTIKDVEVIITKVTGKSLGLTDAWDAIKSFFSGVADLSPAAILSPSGEKDAEQVTILEESVPSASEPDIAPKPSSILSDFDITPPPESRHRRLYRQI